MAATSSFQLRIVHRLKNWIVDFLSFEMGQFEQNCRSHGIKLEKTVLKTPQQNGVAKRMNRTICDRIRCMLSHAFIHVPRDKRSKLDNKTKQCIFLGYSNEDFGYREVVQEEQVDTIDRNDESTVDDIEENPTIENDGLKQQQEQAISELPTKTQLRRSTKECKPSRRDFLTHDKMSLIQVVLGLAASMNLELEQLDVKTSFLHDLSKSFEMNDFGPVPSNPSREHWAAVKWSQVSEGYAGDVDSRKSTSGYLITFQGEQCHGNQGCRNVLLCRPQRLNILLSLKLARSHYG
ncbi:hypothetical protein CK203_025003 [Vitis vinifera]|uniref:Retroviral polymerase SH3-like domain-containing protein n=1 Tax=Vitis vinifera TaxID=29760 RepID=A0A438J753_VITVI|nr:hypothetical protein CK203_025003 [Vitis vinifera]